MVLDSIRRSLCNLITNGSDFGCNLFLGSTMSTEATRSPPVGDLWNGHYSTLSYTNPFSTWIPTPTSMYHDPTRQPSICFLRMKQRKKGSFHPFQLKWPDNRYTTALQAFSAASNYQTGIREPPFPRTCNSGARRLRSR